MIYPLGRGAVNGTVKPDLQGTKQSINYLILAVTDMWNDFPYGFVNIGLRCLKYSDTCKIREDALIRKDVHSRRSYTMTTLDYKSHNLIRFYKARYLHHHMACLAHLDFWGRGGNLVPRSLVDEAEERVDCITVLRVKKGVRLERKDLMARKSHADALKPILRGKNPTVLQCKRMRTKYEINDPMIVWKPAN